MEARMESRLAGVAGVAGFALTLIGGGLAGEFATPAGTDTAAVVAHFGGRSADAAFTVGMILETLGFLLILALLAGLARAVGGREDRAGWLGSVIVVSAVVAIVLTCLSIVSLGAAAFRGGHGGFPGDGFVVLSDLRLVAYWVSLPVWALVYLASGTVIVGVRSFPSWFGWTAVVLGALHVVLPFAPTSTWDVVTGLGGLWMTVAAVLILVRPGRYPVSSLVDPVRSGHRSSSSGS